VDSYGLADAVDIIYSIFIDNVWCRIKARDTRLSKTDMVLSSWSLLSSAEAASTQITSHKYIMVISTMKEVKRRLFTHKPAREDLF